MVCDILNKEHVIRVLFFPFPSFAKFCTPFSHEYRPRSSPEYLPFGQSDTWIVPSDSSGFLLTFMAPQAHRRTPFFDYLFSFLTRFRNLSFSKLCATIPSDSSPLFFSRFFRIPLLFVSGRQKIPEFLNLPSVRLRPRA